jgi:putative transposase
MNYRTNTNIHGKTGGGNVFYDKRFELAWKIAKEQDLSKEGQNRLRWMDYYGRKQNAALTCRYFGISESCFWKWGKKQRIKNLVAHGTPGEHIQMDTVVLYRNSTVYYIKTAIDTVTKIAFAYAYKGNSSAVTTDFLKKLQYLLPYEVKNVHTDNGSEFLGKFHETLQEKQIGHYFSYPHCPKQHGTVERFNGILRREFLEEGNMFYNLETLNKKLIKWLIEYNFHRPHTTLGYLTPLVFYEQNFVQSNRYSSTTESSSMYWTYTLD